MTDTEIVHIVHLRESNHESNVDDIKNEPQPKNCQCSAGPCSCAALFVGENNAEEALGHVYCLQN